MYLDDRIRAAATVASIGLILLAVGVGFVWQGPASVLWAQSKGLVDFIAAVFHSGMNPVAGLFMASCFIPGTAMAILGTAKLISFSTDRSRMTDRDVVPVEWIGRCFEEEFSRVLELRKLDVKNGASENQGYNPAPSASAEYLPLPAFMGVEQLPAEALSKAVAANGGTVNERRWQLVGVYDRTPQDLIADPPPEWRKMMAEN
jgi:hypothetical protein